MIQRFGYMKNNPYLCINKKKTKINLVVSIICCIFVLETKRLYYKKKHI